VNTAVSAALFTAMCMRNSSETASEKSVIELPSVKSKTANFSAFRVIACFDNSEHNKSIAVSEIVCAETACMQQKRNRNDKMDFMGAS
jgi:excinuclease UvrABC nuclease subunit